MIACLKKINGFVRDAVHEAVFLRDTARSTTREKVPERLRFAESLEWIAHYGIDEIQYPESGITIGLAQSRRSSRNSGWKIATRLVSRFTQCLSP